MNLSTSEKKREVITILGKSGSGKTSLAKSNVIPKLRKPVFIYDPLGEYNIGVVFESMDEFYTFVRKQKKNKSGIYSIQCKTASDRDKFLEFLEKVNFPSSFVFEETSTLCDPSDVPEALYNKINYGRHYAVSLVFLARRTAEISRNCTAQSNCIVSFQQTEPRDVNYFKSIMGGDAGNLPELYYDPKKPHLNEFVVMGTSSVVPFDAGTYRNADIWQKKR